jgi:hypothetical protein
VAAGEPALARDFVYQALVAGLHPDHCVICRLSQDSVERHFQAFFYEQVNDPWVRHAMVSARGFCPTHAWRRPGLHDASGLSIVYHHLLSELHVAFRAAVARAARAYGTPTRRRWRLHPGRGIAGTLAAWMTPRAPCPVCVTQWQAEDRYAAVLARAAAADEFRERYRESFGVCMPHLILALGQGATPAAGDWLVAVEGEKLARLLWELSEYIRKLDYRFRHETVPREATAWQRAIEKLVGAPGMVWRRLAMPAGAP